MKISIHSIRKLEASSIADAIEKIASASDTIASGIIGPTFSCSGPGSGWQRNHDVTDYAARALDDGYGALSYIDSADGREATLNAAGEVEWSDDSVVEIVLPSVEEALDNRAEYDILIATAADYGTDEDEIEQLETKVAAPYRITDGNASEYAETLDEAAEIAADWYDFLVNDEKLDEVPAADLDASDLDALTSSIAAWEQRIAEAMGVESFAGHGNYYVRASDRAGLRLTVSIRE